MGWFREAGKKFEETKREFMNAKVIPYRCSACEESLTEHYDRCPYCGEDAVESVD